MPRHLQHKPLEMLIFSNLNLNAPLKFSLKK